MSIEKVTEVTPELLAMTWPNDNACRMWLKRRGTTPTKLGLLIGMAPEEGVCLQLVGEKATIVSIEETAPVSPDAWRDLKVEPQPDHVAFKTGTYSPEVPAAFDSELARSMDPVASVNLEAPLPPGFEDYAGAVDTLLQDAEQAAEPDATVLVLFGEGKTPEQAFEAILAARAPATPLPSVASEEPILLFGEAEEPARGVGTEDMPDRPAPSPDTVVGAAHIARVDSPAGAAWIDQLGGLFFVQVGLPMERDAAVMWAGQVAKWLKADCHVCDAATGKVVQSVHAKKRVATFTSTRTGQDDTRKRSSNTLPLIVELLERPEGASGEEIKAQLGWATVPGPWFFRKWAGDAKRSADLVDLGKVGGVRRFRLATSDGAAAAAERR